MIATGLGIGFKIQQGGDRGNPYTLDFLRPPHTVSLYFKRKIESQNWKPMMFSIEREPNPIIWNKWTWAN